jgi:excisionase family DNA binding protein
VAKREVLTVDEAAKVLRLGRSAAYKAVRAKEIPSIRIGRRILVPVAALDDKLRCKDFFAQLQRKGL